MPSDAPKPFNIWTPLTFSVILILGILIGFQLNRYMDKKRPITTVIERNDRLEEIIDIISARYVDSVSTDSLYEDAISGILKHLDPHTSYIPARDMTAVTEDLEGNFKGIGIEFFILRDTIMVTSVLTNGPSYEAGLKAGDKIIRVNDSTVAGVQITNEGIVGMLRGIEGSSVKLTLMRPAENHSVNVQVERGIIPLYSVDASYMMDKETGYIRINRFSATTYREFMNALKALQKEGMKKLVLDLRQNPGGYLDAATAIADELIGENRLLVYTQGRTSAKEEYISGQKGRFEQGPLAILVDEGSASASEILAGAVQDWDRGVIIGRRTYGKGLVQEQFELEDGSALRLTTARYYTPSGRSIQRPYNKGKEAYAHSFAQRFQNGSLTSSIDTLNGADTQIYYTEKRRRRVFGGGGIKPDIIVPYESSIYATELYDLLSAPLFNSTIYEYFSVHSKALGKYHSFREFDASFSFIPELVEDLKKSLASEMPEQVARVWNNASARSYITTHAKAILARMMFRNNGYYQETNKEDQVILKALQTFKSPVYSNIIGGQSS